MTALSKRLIPTATVLAALAGSTWAQEQKFFISGYGNVHYMDHRGLPGLADSNPNDSFLGLREFSLFMDFPINDMLIASAEIEMGDSGNTFTSNYAYLDIQATEELKFRVGKFLVPFLDYNENKPNYLQSLMSQPFTAWIMAPVNGSPIKANGIGWSDVGVMGDWMQEAGEVGLLDLKLAVMNGIQSPNDDVLDSNSITLGSGPTIRPRDGFIQNEADLGDNNDDKAVVAKITYQDYDTPLNTGISVYQGKWDNASTQNLFMYGLHANWVAERYSIKGEYSIAEVDQVAGVLVPSAPPLNTSTGDYKMTTYYLEGTYTAFVWPEDRWLKFIARYDAVDSNDQATFTPFRRDRWTGGLEWQFSPGARFRAEYQRSTIADFENAPGPYIDAGGKENIDMLMFSVVFWF